MTWCVSVSSSSTEYPLCMFASLGEQLRNSTVSHPYKQGKRFRIERLDPHELNSQATFPINQSIKAHYFVKRHKSRANRRRVANRTRGWLWQKQDTFNNVLSMSSSRKWILLQMYSWNLKLPHPEICNTPWWGLNRVTGPAVYHWLLAGCLW